MKAKTYVALVLALSTSACASIMGSDMQTLTVSTTTEWGIKVHAKCTLENENGSWVVDAPDIVNVRRAASNLDVRCTAPGMPDGVLHVISNGNNMSGNLIAGGLIGMAIDHGTGRGYEYPSILEVLMGKERTIGEFEKPSHKNGH